MNKTNISTAATTSVKNNIATFVVDNNGNVCERSQYKGSLRKDGKKYGICTRKYFDTVEDAEAQLNSEKELINNSSSVLFSTINKFIITKTDNTNKVLRTVNLKGSGFDYEEIKRTGAKVKTTTGVEVTLMGIIRGKIYGYVHNPSLPSCRWENEFWNMDGKKFKGADHYHDLVVENN